MCGIAGWFSPAPLDPPPRERLTAMIDAIRHRGPDGQGIAFTQHAALGHRRLAIIDLEGGAQPMASTDSSVYIVFNGEIYNYRSLRDELVRKGVTFRSHSDTEVILELYRNQGPQGFTKLRGMYAFAVWDGNKNIGILCRDPLGIKPLFIHHDTTDNFYFASEAKSILSAGAVPAKLDERSLHLLLNFRYLPGDGSLFHGISQVPPGGILEWSTNGTVRTRQIVDYPDATPRHPLEVLEDSIKMHLTADVEVGAYLSGGMDSAAVTAVARQWTPLRTFTLDVGDDPAEARNAARTAALLGIPNTQDTVATNTRDDLVRSIWHLELPKVNALQVYRLASVTSRHVKVALSGLGGDELFLGYNAHHLMHLADTATHYLPAPVRSSIGQIGNGLFGHLGRPFWTESERAFLMLRHLGNWPRVYGTLRNVWDSPTLRRRIYGPRLLDCQLPDAFSVLEDLWPDQADPVLAMARFEWSQKMVNDLLWQEDRVSMAHGLEVRVPFVDIPLAQAVRALDRRTLMPRGQPKGYMRQMLAALLPDEILRRPKSGFQIDSPRFFHDHLKPLTDEFLTEDYVRAAGLFNPSFMKAVLRCRPGKRLRWHYFMLYLMLGTHLWIELFEKRSWPAAA